MEEPLVSNGTRRVRTISFYSTRKTSFALFEMEDVGSLLLVQELYDDFDGCISDIVWAVSSLVLFWADHSQIFAVWVQTPLFTITAEIHARSLANFYGQYADRHMKFVRRVSEREREIRQFVTVKYKLMLVFNASVLLLTMNFVITLSK